MAGLTLKSSAFYGGSGDQLGTGIVINNGAIFLSASSREDIFAGSHISHILNYTLPPGGTPAWSRSFDYGTHFYGLSVTGEGIYCAGWSYGLSSDPVGGKEVKSFMGKFNLDGSSGPGTGGCLWYKTPIFFGYSGHEQFCGATSLIQDAVPYTYAVGFGEPGSPRSGFFIAKYDTLGNQPAWATEPFPMNTYNYSFGNAATAYNGAIFSVGSSSWLAPGAGWPLKPTLWKHDANLSLLKRNEYTAFMGELRGVTAFAGAIYAVGNANTPAGRDFLIMKYDEDGNYLWHRISGGTGEDVLTGVVGIGSKLFAVGYTRSEGAGSADIVVMQIDPNNGDLLDKVLYGGAQDDLANGCATDGTDLFIVGYSRSFAVNGNAIGEYEVVLLQYGVAPPNQPPVANSGSYDTAHVGTQVALNASASYDPDGNYPLTYEWQITSAPAGSGAVLSDPTAVTPTFTPDLPGDYVVGLVVKDSLGLASAPTAATVSTYNTAPVADAGPDQAIIALNATVPLNGLTEGRKSYDLDGDPLSFQWSFVSRPTGSSAILANANTATPSFVADVHGDFIIQLVVSDSWASSPPGQVTVSFTNVKPVATATTTTPSLVVGDTATINGSGTDDNGDPLTYAWTLTAAPVGSTSVLLDPASAATTFLPDLPGTYAARLVVNDGFTDSDPSMVQVEVITMATKVTRDIQTCLQAAILALKPTDFKNANMQKTLINKTNSVIVSIEAGNYQEALGQLKNDILGKTDGCATGAPDKNDWIIKCNAQQPVYDCLVAIIAEMEEGHF